MILNSRKIEGFPIGSDADILALSDPPYYTACPNPFIEDFIRVYGKPYDEKSDHYSREPFAADISEGKYEPIYKLHPYPTKVPHKAIMRYILHYTNPGDLVFDGFCGTGMTGVAAQACINPDSEFKSSEEKELVDVKWGGRKAILVDLSPAATFIARNCNDVLSTSESVKKAYKILSEVEQECKWMYETRHSSNDVIGLINYVAWSDVFICSQCSKEIVFWEVAANVQTGTIADKFPCPHCGVICSKSNMMKAFEIKFDKILNHTVKQSKRVPVLINYSVGGSRYEKKPDLNDLKLIEKIEALEIPYWFPTNRMPEGDESRRNDDIGLTHVHHFYTKRNLWALATFISKGKTSEIGFYVTRVASRITKMYGLTYQNGVWGAGGGPLSGTLYIASLTKELNILKQIKNAIADRAKITNNWGS